MNKKQTMLAMLAIREELVSEKRMVEERLKIHDNDIKVYMIQNGVTEFVREDGLWMKIANGKNTTIIQKRVIDTLVELGFDPDQVKWFLKEVTQEKEYDFIDMRKVKIDNGQKQW